MEKDVIQYGSILAVVYFGHFLLISSVAYFDHHFESNESHLKLIFQLQAFASRLNRRKGEEASTKCHLSPAQNGADFSLHHYTALRKPPKDKKKTAVPDSTHSSQTCHRFKQIQRAICLCFFLCAQTESAFRMEEL